MFRRKRSAKDFAEEIKTHLELEADQLREEGRSDDDARRKRRQSGTPPVKTRGKPGTEVRFSSKVVSRVP